MGKYSFNKSAESFGIGDATTLLLDNQTYRSRQRAIRSSENQLILKTDAFAMENNVCGTECMSQLAKYWHKTEDTDKQFRSFTTGDVDYLCSLMLTNINNTAAQAASKLSFDASTAEEVGDNKPFDGEGQYGGNQSGPDKGFNIFGFIIGEDEDLYAFVKKHKGYENYSKEQIHKLLKQLEEGGCSYVAAANAIFNSYVGKQDQFEKDFGFPMYDEDGELNYDMLLVDYFCETNDKVYLDGPESYTSYSNSEYNYYKDHPDEYEDKYGEALMDENGELSENFFDNMFESYKELMDEGKTEVTIDLTGGSAYAVPNKLDHYMTEHGGSMTYSLVDPTDLDDIQSRIDQGYVVVFAAEDFELEHESGWPYCFGYNIGPHEMTITGITDDGRYIVSTWGEELYFDPEEYGDTIAEDAVYCIKVREAVDG